ncbi:Protein SENSITIVITY TO RED LIGHT REDUCED 1 [Forsythia ovata]|uniref:Protein SENSITIVITY TO RED LIGHT REDUCED 1 n=1 Tax=Forsythia ovata TaxID=205694 RepID=A0ABD1WU72_9LAMI
MQKMQICIQKLENSEFFLSFLDQMQNPDMLAKFLKVLGPETKMLMVIYGIGSIESFEPPRLQLSLAILMKKKFDWIGEKEVFDPVIYLMESKILTSLGCSVLFYQLMSKVADNLYNLHYFSCHTVRLGYTTISCK